MVWSQPCHCSCHGSSSLFLDTVAADIAIKDNMLFSGLPQAGLAAVIDSMQPQMIAAGKDIIKQVSYRVVLTSKTPAMPCLAEHLQDDVSATFFPSDMKMTVDLSL